jgi:hypothetical protein
MCLIGINALKGTEKWRQNYGSVDAIVQKRASCVFDPGCEKRKRNIQATLSTQRRRKEEAKAIN